MRNTIKAITFTCLIAVISPFALSASKELMVDDNNVAANGYDVVAYHDNKALRGSGNFMVEYNGAKWYFDNPENQATFQSSPAKYVPVYGGFCAYAVSQGYIVKTDPLAWSVHDGKLYLNFNGSTRTRWLSDRDNYIAIADKFWPRLIK